MKSRPLPSADILREHLSYDPSTGALTWRRCRCNGARMSGLLAGSISNVDGYRRLMIDGRKLLAHRVIWKMVHGTDPQNVIDHVNGEKSDLRLANLREATAAQNHMNQAVTRGAHPKGVYFHKARGKFQAQIKASGRKQYLGLFDTAQEAHEAYVAAAKEAFGVFFNPGKNTESVFA